MECSPNLSSPRPIPKGRTINFHQLNQLHKLHIGRTRYRRNFLSLVLFDLEENPARYAPMWEPEVFWKINWITGPGVVKNGKCWPDVQWIFGVVRVLSTADRLNHKFRCLLHPRSLLLSDPSGDTISLPMFCSCCGCWRTARLVRNSTLPSVLLLSDITKRHRNSINSAVYDWFSDPRTETTKKINGLIVRR